MNKRRDPDKSRIRIPVGIRALVTAFAMAIILCGNALGGEVTPGAVFIAENDAGEHGTWTSVAKCMATLEAECRFDQWDGVVFGPKPYLVAPAGGAGTQAVERPGFHSVAAPAAGTIVSTLRYELAGKVTAFSMHAITFRFDTDGERRRYGPFSNTGGGSVTFTASAEADGIMTAFVYDAEGSFSDTFYLDLTGNEITQATYARELDAFTVQLVPGCIGWGPCGGAVNSYVIATNTGPDTDAEAGNVVAQTIEVSYGEAVPAEVSLKKILGEMALVALRPPDLTQFAQRHATLTPAEIQLQEWIAAGRQ